MLDIAFWTNLFQRIIELYLEVFLCCILLSRWDENSLGQIPPGQLGRRELKLELFYKTLRLEGTVKRNSRKNFKDQDHLGVYLRNLRERGHAKIVPVLN